MKNKLYSVCFAGGKEVTRIKALCLVDAAKHFVKTLATPATFRHNGKQVARIFFKGNYSAMGDFVIFEV